MPIEIGLWRLDEDSARRVSFSAIETESRLEKVLANDISILGLNLLLIGQQVPTSYGKLIDLLAMDANGDLVVIELKRDRTSREIIAQLLDYGSWIRGLEDEDIAGIFENYQNKYHSESEGKSLDQSFCESFNVKELPESLNESHELVVVAGELDDSTERIIDYLAEEYGVAINAVFFRFFKDGQSEYLSRAWLIDPVEAEVRVIEKQEKAPWNGEFYVSFGHDDRRHWEDARKYGFIAGGGGSWYSQTLRMLEPGDRFWANVPGRGYVGVGHVVKSSIPVNEFTIKDDSGLDVPITTMTLKATNMYDSAETEENREHLVRVEWIKTVSLDQAIREKGFFGNQNTVAKPRAKKWVHTVERLKKRFEITD